MRMNALASAVHSLSLIVRFEILIYSTSNWLSAPPPNLSESIQIVWTLFLDGGFTHVDFLLKCRVLYRDLERKKSGKLVTKT